MGQKEVVFQGVIHPFQVLAVVDMAIHIDVKITDAVVLIFRIFQDLVAGSPLDFLDFFRLIGRNQIIWNWHYFPILKINEDKVAEDIHEQVSSLIIDIEFPITEEFIVGNRLSHNADRFVVNREAENGEFVVCHHPNEAILLKNIQITASDTFRLAARQAQTIGNELRNDDFLFDVCHGKGNGKWFFIL